MYTPRSTFDGEDFDWDAPSQTLFDERIEKIMSEVNNRLTVESIHLDKVGGFTLVFSEGYELDVFPACSKDDELTEFWWFISYNK